MVPFGTLSIPVAIGEQDNSPECAQSGSLSFLVLDNYLPKNVVKPNVMAEIKSRVALAMETQTKAIPKKMRTALKKWLSKSIYTIIL